MTPCTNPIVTPMCNAMFAVKGKNVIIIAPHPEPKVRKRLKELYDAELTKMGVPTDIFQVIEEPSIELTNELMKAVDVVIATGGMGMVKAAYSSGKPSFGVGAGNVQGLIEKGYDISVCVPKIVAGRIFDNGIICSGEQTAIAHKDDFEAMLAEFEKNGAYIVRDKDEMDRLRDTLSPGGKINKDAVGASVAKIAEMADIKIPEGCKLLVVLPEKYGEEEQFAREDVPGDRGVSVQHLAGGREHRAQQSGGGGQGPLRIHPFGQ